MSLVRPIRYSLVRTIRGIVAGVGIPVLGSEGGTRIQLEFAQDYGSLLTGWVYKVQHYEAGYG